MRIAMAVAPQEMRNGLGKRRGTAHPWRYFALDGKAKSRACGCDTEDNQSPTHRVVLAVLERRMRCALVNAAMGTIRKPKTMAVTAGL